LRELTRSFFLRNTEAVARELLGMWFARRYSGRWYGGRIVETEAYLGVSDRAAHSWGGRRTPRVEPMYQEGGRLYVFLVYGMYNCANVVTRERGRPEAVLLRAADAWPNAPHKLMSGPGKLCAALGITVAQSGVDLLGASDLRLFRDPAASPTIAVSRRIGVDYAGEAMHWPLRFFDADSKAVSGPKSAPENRIG
jgi:DNA-3-methyladenine glycosylase